MLRVSLLDKNMVVEEHQSRPPEVTPEGVKEDNEEASCDDEWFEKCARESELCRKNLEAHYSREIERVDEMLALTKTLHKQLIDRRIFGGAGFNCLRQRGARFHRRRRFGN